MTEFPPDERGKTPLPNSWGTQGNDFEALSSPNTKKRRSYLTDF